MQWPSTGLQTQRHACMLRKALPKEAHVDPCNMHPRRGAGSKDTRSTS